MNLLAHAEVVRRLRLAEPEHLVGAMLPDLAGIARFRIPELPSGPLADGVALHHQTDEAFHRSLRFRNWCAAATRRLTDAGLGRGPARASAHLAVELFIDGELARITDVAGAVERALRETQPQIIGLLPDEASRARAGQVLDWIGGGGLRSAYQDTEAVGQAVERILSRRPRLALGPGGRERCTGELRIIDRLVTPMVPTVIDEAIAHLAG